MQLLCTESTQGITLASESVWQRPWVTDTVATNLEVPSPAEPSLPGVEVRFRCFGRSSRRTGWEVGPSVDRRRDG